MFMPLLCTHKQQQNNMKTTNNKLPCASWLHGKHTEEIEINTKLPYVAIYDYFAQGDEAENIITEILEIYDNSNYSPLEACEIWANNYL